MLWCHYEQTGAVVEAVRNASDGWADVLHAPFESQGADVREL
jgi:homoserine kinase